MTRDICATIYTKSGRDISIILGETEDNSVTGETVCKTFFDKVAFDSKLRLNQVLIDMQSVEAIKFEVKER